MAQNARDRTAKIMFQVLPSPPKIDFITDSVLARNGSY